MAQVSSKCDIEAAIRRLRGEEVKKALRGKNEDSELQQLKTIVKTLGYKLQDAYQELAAKNVPSTARDKEALWCEAEELKEQLGKKQQELDSLRHAKEKIQITCDMLQQKLQEEKPSRREAVEPRELSFLKEEIAGLRKERATWKDEKEKLENTLDKERVESQERLSSNGSQLVKLTMACKQFEEEIGSLASERTVILHQLAQIKELQESTQKTFHTEQQAYKGEKESFQVAISNLSSMLERQQAEIVAMHEERKALEGRENAVQQQLSFLQTSLSEERQRVSSLDEAKRASEQIAVTLRTQLEEALRDLAEWKQRHAQLDQEHRASRERLQEVENHLVTKLQAVADLEEDLDEETEKAEALEKKLSQAELEKEQLRTELHKKNEAHQGLQQSTTKLESKLSSALSEVVELRRRLETFERMKKAELEALSHAHAICRLFDSGPKTPYFAAYEFPENRAPKAPEPVLRGDQLEQHDLF